MKVTGLKNISRIVLSAFLAIVVVMTSLISVGIQSKAEDTSICTPIGYTDDFDSYKNGDAINGKNGWISQIRGRTDSHVIEDGALKVEDFSSQDGWRTSIVNRPISENMINQRVKVDVKNLENTNNGATANLHLRMQYSIYDSNAVANNSNKYGAYDGYIAHFSSGINGKIEIRAYTGCGYNGNWGDKKPILTTTTFKYTYGHEYSLEFIATGVYPTTLTANLYDKTLGKIAATATCEDSTEDLQRTGTVGLSHTKNGETNRTYSLFDNFEYTQADTTICHDDFNRADTADASTINNDWSVPDSSKATAKIYNNQIYLKNNESSGNGIGQVENSAAMMRPISEAKLHSTSEIEYTFKLAQKENGRWDTKENSGVSVFARVQDDRPTSTNNYRAVLYISDRNNEMEYLSVYAGDKLLGTIQTRDYSYQVAKHKLSITVTSLNSKQTKVTAISYKWETNSNGRGGWQVRSKLDAVDETEELQNPGTSGFTIYKKYNSSELLVNDFNYTTLDGILKPTKEVFIFSDDFNRTNGNINDNNGWNYISRVDNKSHLIEDNVLKVQDFKYMNTWSGATSSILTRPISESFLNQKVTVDLNNLKDLKGGATANMHLRVMNSDGVDNNGFPNSVYSYFAEVSNNTIKIKYTDNKNTVHELYNTNGKCVEGNYSINEAHKYRLEFSAEDIYPTVLTASLFDITDDKTVTTVVAKNNVKELQRLGTSGISATGSNDIQYALFDNYDYRNIDDVISQDNFKRVDSVIGNDWIASNKIKTELKEKHLSIKSTATDDGKIYMDESALIRPLDETSFNQSVDVEFSRGSDSINKSDIGITTFARVQGDTISDENNYRATVILAEGSADSTKGRLLVNGGKTEIGNVQLENLNPDSKYRLQLSVSNNSEIETQIVVTLYNWDTQNSLWNVKYQNIFIDSNETIQKDGFAGIGIYDKNRGSINVYSFQANRLISRDYPVYNSDSNAPYVFTDDFENVKDTINKKNGWIDQQACINGTNIAIVSNGKLVINNTNNDYLGTTNKYKIMRPINEATLNQRVSVDIINLGEITKAEIDLRMKESQITEESVNKVSFYSVEVSKTFLRICTSISWVSGKLAGVEYNYVEGHTYKLVASAQGSIPTIITAYLYDVTDGNKLVATVSASDESLVARDKRTAQIPGTVGVAGCGDSPVILDNFKYEQIDDVICHDIFNRENGAVNNNWSLGSNAGKTVIKDNQMVIDNNSTDNMFGSAVMRPISEATLNQSARIQFSRPEKSDNLSEPIVFVRAQTNNTVKVDSYNGFATYYAQIKFVESEPWHSYVCVYKVNTSGKTTKLHEGYVKDYGRDSDKSVNLVLMAEGNSPTKLTVLFYADSTNTTDQKFNMIYNASFTDNDCDLPSGTAGVSFSNSNKNFAIEKFSYSKLPEVPADIEVPEDMAEDYMVYFNGTAASGEFGQWMELDPSETYIYTVKWKTITTSGGFGARLLFQPHDWGPVTKYIGTPVNKNDTDTVATDIISNTYDEDTMVQVIEFKVPSGAKIQQNGKVKVKAIIHEGGIGTYAYATNFLVYKKEDASKTNLLINSNFKKGFYGWNGNGNYPQPVSDGNVLVTPGTGEANLITLDENVFVKDDSDKYFNDLNWSKGYVNGNDFVSGGTIKGTIKSANGKPLSDVEVLLDWGSKTTKTDKNGNFEFENVEPASYFLSIKLKDGTECDFEDPIDIEAEQTVVVNLVYDVESEKLQGEVEEYEDNEDNEDGENSEKDNSPTKKIIKIKRIKNANDDTNSNIWWIVLIVAVVVIGSTVYLIFIIKKRKKNNNIKKS